MIPAGDFVLNASLVLGRLTFTILIEEAGRIGICSDYVFWGPEPHLIRYIKGIAERHLGRYFFGGGFGGGRNLYAI